MVIMLNLVSPLRSRRRNHFSRREIFTCSWNSLRYMTSWSCGVDKLFELRLFLPTAWICIFNITYLDSSVRWMWALQSPEISSVSLHRPFWWSFISLQFPCWKIQCSNLEFNHELLFLPSSAIFFLLETQELCNERQARFRGSAPISATANYNHGSDI